MIPTPTGRLKAGLARVAGVATVEVLDELRRLMEEAGLPTMSRAVGVALGEWLAARRGGVVNPRVPADGSGTESHPRGGSTAVRSAGEDA